MKFCRDHALKLRDAVVQRGLGPYLARTPEEASRRLALVLRSTTYNRNNYDPFTHAQGAIGMNALQVIGAECADELSGGDPAQICPLCAMHTVFEEFGDEAETQWIDNAVGEAADAAKNAGLLTVQ